MGEKAFQISLRVLGVIALFDDSTNTQIRDNGVNIYTEWGTRLFRKDNGYYIMMDDGTGKYPEEGEVRLFAEGLGFERNSFTVRIKDKFRQDEISYIRMTADDRHSVSERLMLLKGRMKKKTEGYIVPRNGTASFRLLKDLKKGDKTITIDSKEAEHLEGRVMLLMDEAMENHSDGCLIRLLGRKNEKSFGEYNINKMAERDFNEEDTYLFPVTKVSLDEEGRYCCVVPKGEYEQAKGLDRRLKTLKMA